MRTLVVLFHPNLADSQTQQFLLASLEGESQVIVHKLTNQFLADSINEDLLTAERQRMEQVDRIILQFPLYWYSCPATMKAWIDHVFDAKWAKSIKAKELGVVISLGTQASGFQAGRRERYTISEMLRPFEMMAHNLGWSYLPTFPIYQFSYFSQVEKQQLLVNYLFYLTHENGLDFSNKEQWMLQRAQQFSEDSSAVIQSQAWGQVADWIAELRDERMELKDLLKEMDGER